MLKAPDLILLVLHILVLLCCVLSVDKPKLETMFSILNLKSLALMWPKGERLR